MREVEIYIDGASKGNPGPAGIGVVLCSAGGVIKNIYAYIGNATNNIAEYTALIYGLQECLILKAEKVKVNSDSQLLCRQIDGAYRVKNPAILPLYKQAMHLASGFKEFKINCIPREDNRGADKLANKAVKEAVNKK